VNGKLFYTLPQEKRNEYILLPNGKRNKTYQHKGVYGLSHFFGKDLERLMKGGRRYRKGRFGRLRKSWKKRNTHKRWKKKKSRKTMRNMRKSKK